ncbi:hydrolase [Streptomyces litmocidini]|uniref:phytase n=1 Tax=Streptomyces litmocidini TaxID=67318 RepID=UPI00167EB7AD|nr:phytase [Streptomyces litmocidini]GGU80404.1 hydrolase [Streptomyces litmocidini]
MRSPTRLAVAITVLVTGLTVGTATAATAPPPVYAKAETPPLFDDEAGGNANADDPAIWYNSARPSASLVVGTAKEGGLQVYGLDGHLVQSLPAPAAPGPDAAPGRYNNVDLLPNVRFPDGRRSTVAVATDRGRDRLRLYRIDGSNPTTPLTDVTDASAPRAFAATEAEVDDQFTAYGLATWHDPDSGASYALVSQRNTSDIALFKITSTAGGTLTYHKVRTLRLPSAFDTPGGRWSPCEDPGEGPHIEGIVVDPDHGVAYLGQEDVGVWKVDADLDDEPELVDRTKQFGIPATYDPVTEECVAGEDPGYGGKHLTADTEGLTLFRAPSGDQYLIVSSQGDNTYSVYDTSDDDEWEASFRLAPGSTVDGSEETDGIAALSAPLGSAFPGGLFVAQDGHNAPADGDRENTNYKFVDLRQILDAADLD